jgi:hypothetical protein
MHSSAPSPLIPLKIALFDACVDGASRLARSLDRSLARSGSSALVRAFDAAAPALDLARFDAIFLRGLQGPGKADSSWQAADESIRAALHQADTAYQVLYGNDEESLGQVMRTIEKRGTAPPITAVQSKQNTRGIEGAAPWIWHSDKCSDPQCEHRLLTALLEQRQTAFGTKPIGEIGL